MKLVENIGPSILLEPLYFITKTFVGPPLNQTLLKSAFY
jgi:hypothetical protein